MTPFETMESCAKSKLPTPKSTPKRIPNSVSQRAVCVLRCAALRSVARGSLGTGGGVHAGSLGTGGGVHAGSQETGGGVHAESLGTGGRVHAG